MDKFAKSIVDKALAVEEEGQKIEKRKMPKQRYALIAVLSVIFLIFQIYIGAVRPINSLISSPVHICLALAVTILYKPLAEKHNNKWLWIIDGALLAGLAVTVMYFITNLDRLIYRIMMVDPMLPIDLFCAFFMLVVIMEVVRRTMGMNLFIFIMIFIAYAFLGQKLTGPLRYELETIRRDAAVVCGWHNGNTTSDLCKLNILLSTFWSILFQMRWRTGSDRPWYEIK